MSVWGRIMAAGYDRFTASTERGGLGARREALVGRASGRVIEIGGGTGANLAYYGPAVQDLVITEPEEPMLRKLTAKLARHSLPARIVPAPAERLPVEDESFDFAVSTLVLCTVRDPDQALREIHRVLKPGGHLLFVEHVRSEDARIARRQDRFHGIWHWFGHGCNTNCSTLDHIQRSGLSIVDLERGELPAAPSIVRPLIAGAAQRAAR